jgi:hypothetical protein
MKYFVNVRIDGCYTAAVNAKDIDEAIEKAQEKYAKKNFGEDVYLLDGFEVMSVEDEDGNEL